jgi:hypothetical protein
VTSFDPISPVPPITTIFIIISFILVRHFQAIVLLHYLRQDCWPMCDTIRGSISQLTKKLNEQLSRIDGGVCLALSGRSARPSVRHCHEREMTTICIDESNDRKIPRNTEACCEAVASPRRYIWRSKEGRPLRMRFRALGRRCRRDEAAHRKKLRDHPHTMASFIGGLYCRRAAATHNVSVDISRRNVQEKRTRIRPELQK